MENTPLTWAELRKVLQPAIDRQRGAATWEDVVSGVGSGALHVETRGRSAIVTQGVRWRRKAGVNIWLAGGDLVDVAALVAAVIERAKPGDRVTFEGRMGWHRDKFMKALGFTTRAVVMALDIPQRQPRGKT